MSYCDKDLGNDDNICINSNPMQNPAVKHPFAPDYRREAASNMAGI